MDFHINQISATGSLTFEMFNFPLKEHTQEEFGELWQTYRIAFFFLIIIYLYKNEKLGSHKQ